MTLTRIRSYLRSNEGEYLEDLFKLLSQPSMSTKNTGLQDTAIVLRDLARSSGFTASIYPTAGAPVVAGEIVVDKSLPTILFYGHYDVQTVEPLDLWKTPPFQPNIREGRIYARGSGDNKGQLFANLLAVKAFVKTQGSTPVNVKILYEGEEEVGSPNLPTFVNSNKELLAADVAISTDGHIHPSGRHFVVFGVRGTLALDLVFKGAIRDLHSGHFGGPVRNPAWDLVEALASLRDSGNGRIKIDGFYDSIVGPDEREVMLANLIPLDEKELLFELGLEQFQLGKSKSFYKKLLFEPDLNISGILAGSTGEGIKWLIPSVAKAKLDFRLMNGQDPDDIYSKVAQHFKQSFPNAEVHKIGATPPSQTPIDNCYGKAIADAVRSACPEEEPIIMPSLGSSSPDFVFTKILGIPSIIVPYANADEHNHAPNENLELARFYQGSLICSQIMLNLSSMKRSVQ